MKRQVAFIFISVFISYLLVMPVFALKQTERIALPNKNQVTILYVNDLLDLSCSTVPLSVVLQSLSDKTTTKFILSDRAVGKNPVTLSLQQVSMSRALKRLLRGYSYSSSFENNIETVTVFSSHTGKKTSSQPVASVIKPAEKDVPIRPDTYIAPDTTIEVDEVTTLDNAIVPDTVVYSEEPVTPGDEETIEMDPLKTEMEEEVTDTEEEIAQEDILVSLDDFMPIDLPPANVAYNGERGEMGNNAEQYRQNAAAEKEMRLDRSLAVLASNHTNLYNDALNEVVGIDSPQVTTALFQTATSEKEHIDATTKIVAAEGLWHHAADFGFNDPSSVAALQQMAQDSDPAVRDMERYNAR